MSLWLPRSQWAAAGRVAATQRCQALQPTACYGASCHTSCDLYDWPLTFPLSLQCWVSAAPRRRSPQIPSSCGWTTCCWLRACPVRRKAGARRRRRLQRRPREPRWRKTLRSTRTTGPSSPRSDRSTTRSWRSMNRWEGCTRLDTRTDMWFILLFIYLY